MAAASPATESRPGAAPDARGASGSERKLVSILFADLVGFTTLSEGRDHEAVRDLLSRYFDQCQEIIARYGGTVEKFIGDAVMAVWGAPIAHENDAERAVRAALELVDAVTTLGPDIQARAGVLTGEAAITIGATNQGMVAGDLVNTASRLQSVAPPGTVLVGESTERAANSAIAFEPAGEQVLKGKAAPVPAFRAIRVIAERGGRGRPDQLEPPFVGRDDEFRLIREMVHATGRDRRARLVSITGVAGVGKSRMAWELSKYLDGVVEDIYWHTGRSPAYGEGVTFWALGEMVRGRLRIVEGDDEAVTRAAVADGLTEWIPDENERRWVERALLVLLGLEGATGLPREELFSAWRTFFERIAESGTVVLVFEDVHWADAGLLDFIDHVLDWSKGLPLLLVTLARPELFDRRPGWGAGRRTLVGVALEPLPDAAVATILDGIAPGLPAPATNAIVTRADGIPLYAVETVRMLIAEGRLVADQGRYSPTGDLSQLAVPGTLQALIAARLDALEPADRSLICDAAVLGQSFTPAGLAAVSGLERDSLENRLRSLVQRELLVHDVDPRSPERGQYAFVQALVREVAYGTLARRDRRTRHLAAARFFEGLGEDELAGALASHYLAAYRASVDEPNEARALAAQARIALRAAADRAAALGSHDQATAYFLEAIDVTTDPADRADLRERAGISAMLGGRTETAEEHLRAAAQEWAQLGNRTREARAIGYVGRALVNRWMPHEAVGVLTPAVAAFEDLGDDSGLAIIEHQLARAYWFEEQNPKAIEMADRALGRAERLEDLSIVADTLVTKGALIATSGRPYEGLGILEAGRALAESEGLNEVVGRALLNIGVGYISRDPRQAWETAIEAMTLARRIGFRATLATAAGNAMETAVYLGELDWATATSEEILAMEFEPGDRMTTLRGPIEVCALSGQSTDALIAEYERLMVDVDDPSITSNFHGTVAMVDFAAGRYGDAAEAWEQASLASSVNSSSDAVRAARAALWDHDRARLERLAARFGDGMVHGRAAQVRYEAILGALAGLDGRRDEAVARFSTAIDGYRELGLELELASIAVDMALVLGPDDPTLVAYLPETRARIERLALKPIAAALETALGDVGKSPRGRQDPRSGPGGRAREVAELRES